jgi:2'-5' RNA ligase
MALAIPTLQESDWQYVQSLRERYDPQGYAFVVPHFTLLSLPNRFSKAGVIEILRARLARQVKIPFCVRTAIFMPPTRHHLSWYAFLIPDEGFSGLAKLHHRLYEGPLRMELDESFPFVPHLTVGKFVNQTECLQLVNVINKAPLELSGWITKILLIEAQDNNARVLTEIKLE